MFSSMRRAALVTATAMAFAGAATAQQSRNPILATRILRVADSSQKVLASVFGDAKGSKFVGPEVGQILRANEAYVTASLRSIIDSAGWPGRALVGDSASRAMARLFVQTRDLPLQERALSLMERAVATGDASALDLAFLTDRTRVNGGRQQVYGTAMMMTQFGTAVVSPIADSASVDARRRSVGLGPLADSVAAVRQPAPPGGVQIMKPPVK